MKSDRVAVMPGGYPAETNFFCSYVSDKNCLLSLRNLSDDDLVGLSRLRRNNAKLLLFEAAYLNISKLVFFYKIKLEIQVYSEQEIRCIAEGVPA